MNTHIQEIKAQYEKYGALDVSEHDVLFLLNYIEKMERALELACRVQKGDEIDVSLVDYWKQQAGIK
jgi:hypothetical protein